MTREPAEVLGFFLVLLGVGLILDADCYWGGGALIVVGGAFLGAVHRWFPRGC